MFDPNAPHKPKRSRPWYKLKRTWAGGFVALIVLGSIAGGQDDTSTEPQALPTPASSAPAPSPSETGREAAKAKADDSKGDEESSEAPTREATTSTPAKPAVVPNVVGMNHRDAMRRLHSKGFLVDENSISPGNTFIIRNSKWKVCSQDPAPGATGVPRVTINSVKLDESC